jgi:hypothetical protein
MRRRIFFGLLVFFALFSVDAFADKRVALVIGNSAYKNASKLPNPTNDAAAVSALFKSAGFDVVESHQNLGVNEMKRVIRDFTDNVRDADIAVVFYAGHGIEVDGTNYLIPVDALLRRDVDVEDEAVPLDRLTRMLDPARRLRLVMLDACRDNPFITTMKRTMGTRAIARGLAKVEPTSTDTLIAFAAKAGSTASDGNGTNSPFTTALLNNIATPGLDLRIAFGRVRDDVLKATANRQEPFVYGSLGGSTVALIPPPAEAVAPAVPGTAAPAVPPVNFGNDMRKDYDAAKEIGTKGAWEAFLNQYNVGLYADLAREALAKLNAEEAKKKPQTPATASAPAAPPTSAPPAPKSADAQQRSGAAQVVCGKNGCQEVKPGCTVVEIRRGSGSNAALGAQGSMSGEAGVICK